MNQMVLFNEIIRLALLLNNLSKHDVVINYSGHVNEIEFRIFENGWRKFSDPDKIFTISLKEKVSSHFMLKEVIDYLNELYMNTEIVELVQKGAECFA